MSTRLKRTINLDGKASSVDASVSIIQHLFLALWHIFVLLPLTACTALVVHAVTRERNHKEAFATAWPVRRLKSWSWDETIAVAITTHAMAACIHLEKLPFTPPMESVMPRLSQLLMGVRHQGWQIQCESIIIPAIPTSEGKSNKSSLSSTLQRRPKPVRILTEEALPYSSGISFLLQGQISTGTPLNVAAMWLWKTQAAHVKAGEVVAVKPAAEHGGLGCGEAGDDEKVILFLAGSGVNINGPVLGPMAWTITRQSGLRMLIIKKQGNTGPRTYATSLQDALAGYAYLVDRLGFLPRNITLLGEGAGAGLCVSLNLYLSSIAQNIKTAARIGRPGKMLLFSPWCDMTVSKDILRRDSKVDILDLNLQLQARDMFLETLGKKLSEEEAQKSIEELCRPYTREEGKLDLSRLGEELPNTIDVLGAYHPLISPGMPLNCNNYTRIALQLLGTQSGGIPLRVLICAGNAETHITEARSLANNLSSVEGLNVDYIEGEDKVTNFSFVTASQANRRVDEVSQIFLNN